MRINRDEAQRLRKDGKSLKDIAKQLNASVSGVAKVLNSEKAKFSMTAAPPVNSKLSNMHMLQPSNSLSQLPPGGGNWAVDPWQSYAGAWFGGRRFYLPADQAIQQSRENARAMYQSLIVREPLQARLWTAALQDWHVSPKDEKNPEHAKIAESIQQTIECIPDFLKLRYSLLKSRWFGAYGANLVYRWNAQKKLYVDKWVELHGDSLSFKADSEGIGIYVAQTHSFAKRVSTQPGYIGQVHVFEDNQEIHYDDQGNPYYDVGANERDSIIVMTYDPQAADFLDSRNAGGIKGLGIRSTVYPTWYQMTELIGNLMDWCERQGTGIVMYKFLRNNEESYQAAVTLAESASNQAAVMVPVDIDENGGKPLEGVEIVHPDATGLDNMLKIVEFFKGQIHKFIVGQESTSENKVAGLGSKIAEVHESTFGRIIAFDCVDLQETLTRQLVHVIQKYDFPGTEIDAPCRFVIDYDSPDAKEQIENAKALYEMDIPLVMDEIRSAAGFSKPGSDDEVIRKSQQQQPPGQQKPAAGLGAILGK